MTESQFILWLKGFLSSHSQLNSGDIAMIKATLNNVTPTGESTNESTSPTKGKTWLHG